MVEETNKQKPSLLGIITSPAEQFERIRERPLIWGAMGIIVILFIVGISLTFVGLDLSEILTDEIVTDEVGLELDEEFESIVKVTGIIFLFIGGIIGPLIGVLVSTVIFLLVAKIANSSVTFRQLFSMNTYLMIITVLGMIVNGILSLILNADPEVTITSLGSLLNLDGVSGAIMDNFELFGIWNIILTAMGLEIVARFSKGLAWAVPIAIFVTGILFSIMGASIPV